ncbi:MAG: response regulator, partial [Bacteroidota bacterium]|nr:response regulator [Bacteroidota bacterium]
QYYSKALKMSVDISDETGKQSALSNIGLIYSDQHKYKEALIALNEALDINHRLNEVHDISSNLQNIGNIYFNQKIYAKALKYFLRCQDLNISYSIKSPSNLNSLGQVYDELNNHQQALYYFEKAYNTAIEIGDIKNQMITCQNLALLYKYFKEYNKSWKFQNEWHSLSDSINKEIYSKQIAEFQVRSNIDRRNAEKEKAIVKNNIRGTNSDIFYFISDRYLLFISTILLIIMLLYGTFSRNKKIKTLSKSKPAPNFTNRLREILNSSAEAIYFVDSNEKIREANLSFKKLFDLQDHDIVGKGQDELISLSPLYVDPIMEFFASNKDAWSFKRPIRDVVKVRNTNGPEIILELEKKPVFNSDNTKNGIITICHDITHASLQNEKEKAAPEIELSGIKSIVNELFDVVFYVDEQGLCSDCIINQSDILYENIKDIKSQKIDCGVFPPDINKEIIKIIAEVNQSGQGTIFGYNLLQNNTNFEVEAHIRRLNNNQLVILIRKKNAEIVLQHNKKSDNNEGVFLNSPNAYFLIAEDGKIINANAACNRVLGYTGKDKLIGGIFTEFLCNSDRTLTINDIQAFTKNTKARKLYLKRNDNVEFCSEAWFRKIKSHGQKEAILITFRDISPQIKLEEDLKNAYKKVIDSDKVKSFFLANMSHEIRTPMNSIIGFTNILADQSISEDQRAIYLKNINDSSNSLLHLIEDIIDVSKIEAGQISLNEEICYLNEIFSDFYSNYSDLHEKELQTDIEFKIRLGSKDADFAILTDVFRFKQIMSNIISNAFEFTDKGYIEIGYMLPNDEMIEFYVKDTGIGIPENKQELIFDRFRLADESATHVFGGGLGLTISKSLISLMGGSIYVDSQVDIGSNFHFMLPYRPVNPEDQEMSDYDMPPGKTYNFEGKTILVAEDVEPNFQLIKSFLRKTKADLIWAKDGKEAVELCKKQKVDIVVMDIQMPVLNGFEAMKEIKNFNKDMPIIAQTAYAMVDDRPKILAEGFDEYISKPIKVSIFLAIIDGFLN